MNNVTNSGRRILEQLQPEIEKAFMSIPQYGDIRFTVFFNEGEAVRIEVSGAISKRLMPKDNR
jgi:hypothetical protein